MTKLLHSELVVSEHSSKKVLWRVHCSNSDVMQLWNGSPWPDPNSTATDIDASSQMDKGTSGHRWELSIQGIHKNSQVMTWVFNRCANHSWIPIPGSIRLTISISAWIKIQYICPYSIHCCLQVRIQDSNSFLKMRRKGEQLVVPSTYLMTPNFCSSVPDVK